MPTQHVTAGCALDLQQIADDLGKSRKVVVVTGAGISTNCGIPDFRSEDGLYSLIQAQYDKALLNPPWEHQNTFDIDDRPKKKRRQWYYEVVAPNGQVVDVIDEEIKPIKPTIPPEQDSLPESTRRSSRSRSTNTTSSNSRASSPVDLSSDLSSLSSCPSLTPEPVGDSSTEETCKATEIGSSPRRSSRKKSPSGPSAAFPTAGNDENDTILSAPRRTTLQQETSTASSATTATESTSTTQSSQASRTLPNLKGRDLFDAMIWKNAFTTSVFYMFISSLRQRVLEVKDTTETHKFLRALRDGGRLVRNYTQNIDMLEQRVGLSGDLNQGPGNRSSKAKRLSGIGGDINQQRGCESVPLHGTLSKLRCNLCFQHSDWDCEERKLATLSGTAPDCPFCTEASAKRTGNGRRGLAVGRLRPDIVLYGEEHPHANLISPLVTNDLGLALDVMLIMGTSLRVHGLKVMVKEFAKAIHARGGKVVFVNRTRPSESTWGDVIDYWVEMDCDEWVLDLKDRRGDIWSPQGTIVERPARRKSAGTAVERPARRKSEGDAATMSKKRPQATRDDKINGVFITFKILDTLLKFPDSRGHQGTRHPYWQSTSRYSSASVIDVKPAKKALVKKQPSKPPIKMASKASISKAPVMKTIPPMAKLPTRHSMPLKLDTNRNNQAYIVSDVWQRLREKAPGLPAIPPELRQPFTELPGNLPSYLTPFEFGASNHFPNLGGRKEWPLEKMGMDLMHLPPKGLTIPMHTPTSMKPVVPKPINHSYGTRASARGSNTETIVVDSGFPSTPSNSSRHASTQIDTCHTPNTSAAHKSTLLETEDTIIVDDPLTPSSSRIKRLSSIGNLMSSPEDGTEIWHDAPELPEVTTETI